MSACQISKLKIFFTKRKTAETWVMPQIESWRKSYAVAVGSNADLRLHASCLLCVWGPYKNDIRKILVRLKNHFKPHLCSDEIHFKIISYNSE